MSIKLGTERIGPDRVAIDVTVDGSGIFHAEFNDQEFSSKTRMELVEQLTKAVKVAASQRPVDVTVLGIRPQSKQEAARWGGSSEKFTEGIGAVQAQLRGKHERQSHTWLLQTVDKPVVKFQVSYSRDGQICRRLTAEEIAHYTDLAQQAEAAAAALKAYIESVSLDPEEALEEARNARKAVARG